MSTASGAVVSAQDRGAHPAPDPDRWHLTSVVLAALTLALLAWSAYSVRALQPSFWVADVRADAATRVTLVATSTAGIDSRVTHDLSASPAISRLVLALPDAEIASLRLELPPGSGALHIFFMALLDRRRELVKSLAPRLLQPVAPAQLPSAKGLTQLSSPSPDEGAVATIDVRVLYAGGRRMASLLWTMLGVALLGVALNLPRSPLPRLLATPERQRAAAALLALTVLACSAVMARSSRINVHPDESSHLSAAAYYEHEWLPAPVGDPRLDPTMIPGWGRSYLFELDVVYFAAGRLAGLTGLSLASACRLLQWLLLAGVLALAVWQLSSVPALAVVCGLTPQAWYVFSYFNGDAWPLAFALAASLVLCQESLPARLLDGGRSERLRSALGLGLLLGILLISKTNYRVFVVWAISALAIRLHSQAGRLLARRPLQALATVCGSALLLFALRVGYEQAINGFERAERIEAYVESHASPRFLLASNLAGHGLPDMFLRDKGKPLTWLFRHDWLENSSDSALGVYGFLRIRAPASYYRVAGLAVLAVVVGLSFVAWRARAPGARLVLALTLAGAFLVVFQSLYFSWTFCSQSQGRYLFPILPMLVVALAPGAKRVPGRILAPLVLVPFCLSLWSFVAIALERIPR